MLEKLMDGSAVTMLAATLCITQISLGISQTIYPQSQVTGTWRGNSECALENSACHDETNVYRFSAITTQPDSYTGAGFKVIDGKEIAMGTLSFRYDTKTHVLSSDNPSGVFRLLVDGKKIEGTLTRRDGTVFRRIHLTKSK